ncbi:hypothetical protein R1sor_003306 [Riccia sorocarpa]|uniref:Uncharacterized protein n=1 Tax=Riccia sorocarpa TaxID=122646 RepID=A0ABD3H538_9MARC
MALKAFGENIYYTSLQYGVKDLRNSVGMYNLFKVFVALAENDKAKRCSDVVIDWWFVALKEVVLGMASDRLTPWQTPQYPGRQKEREIFKTQIEMMHLREVTDMLQEISAYRVSLTQHEDLSVAEVCMVLGLAFIHSRSYVLAREHLEHAADIYGTADKEKREIINSGLRLIPKPSLHVPMPHASSSS